MASRAILAILLSTVAPLVRDWSVGDDQRRAGLVAIATVLAVLALTARSTSTSVSRWMACVPVVVVGTLAARLALGEAFVPLSVVAALVSARALEPPSSRRPGDSGTGALGPAVVGLVLALVALSAASRNRDLSNLVPATLLAVATAGLTIDRWRPHWSAAAHSGAESAIEAILSSIATIALLVVSLVTLYLPGAIANAGRSVSRAGQRGATPHWTQRSSSRIATNKVASQPFVPTPRRLRRRRLAGALVVLPTIAVLAALALGLIGDPAGEIVTPGNPGSDPADPALVAGTAALVRLEAVPYSERPAFREVPFADEMQRELRQFRFADDRDTVFRNSEFASTYTNVDADGRRRTAEPRCDGCPRATIWLLGGSTAFGLGQRDERTIASEIVREGERAGVALTVQNLGVAGWTIDQEVTDLARRLETSTTAPDMVVFLDGFNDTVTSVFDSTLGRDLAPSGVLRAEDSARVLGGAGRHLDETESREAGQAAGIRYRDVQRRASELVADRGVDLRFFFQPDAFAGQVQASYLPEYYKDEPELLETFDLGAALDAASSEVSTTTTSLRTLFEDRPDPVFWDMVHVNENGAAIIAAAIFDAIRADLPEGKP